MIPDFKLFKSPNIWKHLIGNKDEVPFQSRIFHSFCLVLLAGIFSAFLFNLYLGVHVLAALMLSMVVVLSVIYYYSRVKNKYLASITVFETLNYLVLCVNFYYNSGVDGPSLLLFLFAFFMTVAIVPKHHILIWVPVNIIAVLSILFIQYQYPNWIPNNYSNDKIRFIDMGYTYLFGVFVMLVVFSYMQSIYQKEHMLVQKKTNDLSQSNHTKDKLLSIIAHDFKDPLSSIQLHLQILATHQFDPDKKKELEKSLLQKTKNTNEALTNLLLWAKNQMGGVNPKISLLNVKETLNDVLLALDCLAVEKGITLKSQLEDDLHLMADKDMLQLVVRNLVMNAIKFTNLGGHITLASKHEAERCIFTVTDTGIGINAEQAENLFSLKTKSTIGTKREKGIGMGLLLCKEFTELQGGTISFKSEPGVGSTFFISFPNSAHKHPLGTSPMSSDTQTT